MSCFKPQTFVARFSGVLFSSISGFFFLLSRFLQLLEVAVGQSCGCFNLLIRQPCGFQVSGYLEFGFLFLLEHSGFLPFASRENKTPPFLGGRSFFLGLSVT
jgi:hypothetical protein